MTPEQAKELLPIIKAYSEGKTIQYKNDDTGNKWVDGKDFAFSYDPEHYRIKPDTIKYRSYILCSNGTFIVCGIVANENKSLAQQEETVESIAGFIRWIDKDWVEIECQI